MFQMTIAELQKKCDLLGLTPVPSKVVKKTGEKKVLKKDFIKVLREFYIEKRFGDKPPQHLLHMLRIDSPMLCYRHKALKPEKQQEVWDSDEWVFEEKFDGCRMVVIYVKGEGLFFYSRNISRTHFSPINYDNIWHKAKVEKLLKHFDSFFIDCEVLCRNPHVCRDMESLGVPTETVLQAVASLLALNRKESVALQKAGSPLYFKCFDILMVNDNWDVMAMPYMKRRRGASKVVMTLQRLGMDIEMAEIFEGAALKKQKYEEIIAAKGEGVVAKRKDSVYIDSVNRSKDAWIKIKRSMKGSLTNTQYGDTVDGWISGFQLGEPGKGFENLVGAIYVSVYVRRKDGSQYEHEIARISGISEDLRKQMTVTGIDGKPCMDDDFLDRVVEIDGQCVSSRAKRLKHAVLVRFRDDKYKELCIIDADFLDSMVI